MKIASRWPCGRKQFPRRGVMVCVGVIWMALVGPKTWVSAGETVDDRRIDESSGLAASKRVSDRLWTHNDSGDAARLFAVDGAERRVKVYDVRGADAIDWEDVASAVIDGRPTLVVADTGDNGKRRERVTLYRIDEPEVASSKPLVVRDRIDFRYPDGPADCEAIAIDVERRRVLIVAKRVLPLAGVYAVPLAQDPRAEGSRGVRDVVVAERIGTLPLPMATAMDIREDGHQLAIVSYGDLFLFDRAVGEDWAAALGRMPQHIALPKLKQIEAVCFDRQGEIWVTSEGNPMPLVRVPANEKEK